MQTSFDWRAIRQIRGSQQEAFETLCCHLVRDECPGDMAYERKGKPDAGVECVFISKDGTEWGWQAKFFFTLRESQWTQLDKSVKTALDKHPLLSRYHICLPMDLPDARIKKQRSARERWNDHTKKWTCWAEVRGMSVEFILLGNDQLLDLLSRPSNRGRLWYWFDSQVFDQPWFSRRIDKAIKAAGPRYTPEIHIGLPIAASFEAFSRTAHFFASIKKLRGPVRKALSSLESLGELGRSKADGGHSNRRPQGASLTSLESLAGAVRLLLKGLDELSEEPIGSLPLPDMVQETELALDSANAYLTLLREQERESLAENAERSEQEFTPSHMASPFSERLYHAREMVGALAIAKRVLLEADRLANNSTLVLTGRAGTGKTHLLCDLARNRISAGLPTVLLMGHQFLSNEPPWVQALQNLDLSNRSAEVFVQALEEAARVSGSRALVLIDAMNEGMGQTVWPAHLASFLSSLNSPWISVVLTVRSSYEEIILPEEVGRQAALLEHLGFSGREYDAARSFFAYYGIELPSTPILSPEYRNPLFLKVLCIGLKNSGLQRLPRGIHGITATFNLFFSSINDRLARKLGFDPKSNLVIEALHGIARRLEKNGVESLPREEARTVLDAVFAGRDYHHSLFGQLLSEGVLVEEIDHRPSATCAHKVRIAYQRLSDHLRVSGFLETHLALDRLNLVGEDNSCFAGLHDPDHYLAPGLLESLCLQVPERSGKELVELAPRVREHWRFREAFCQSLLWRDQEAISSRSIALLDQLLQSPQEPDDLLDIIVSLATIPGHPLNAEFLHRRLGQETMPGRDTWWSQFLHRTARTGEAVDRLIDWSWSVSEGDKLDRETAECAAMALAWMLSCPNRWVRDGATKALVKLLSGKLDIASRIVLRFAAVDDPYVSERVFGVAYGCAMRSSDPVEVGNLGGTVYDCVFKEGPPPPHVLLRDYARGVIERAIDLGAKLEVDITRVRPPYGSTWPKIPSDGELEPLKPDSNRGSYDSGDLEWSKNTIGYSVLSGDFARYVIGTNTWMPHWLGLRLGEPEWMSPDERLALLREDMTEKEIAAWESFTEADQELRLFDMLAPIREIKNPRFSAEPGASPPVKSKPELRQAREKALSSLRTALAESRASLLPKLMSAWESDRHPPYVDHGLIQRYVLWRVFNLGWTTERFGHFDRFEVGHTARPIAGSERIGKKYQWIAYHEILGYVADHFQYRSLFTGTEWDRSYDGPWQLSVRDIDPSCALRALPGASASESHTIAWWCPGHKGETPDAISHESWLTTVDDLVPPHRILFTRDGPDGPKYLNLGCYLVWNGIDSSEWEEDNAVRRTVWYKILCYLVPAHDAPAFLGWAEKIDLWTLRTPEPSSRHELFLGEHAWSPGARWFKRMEDADYERLWTPNSDRSFSLAIASTEYHASGSGFDCSTEDSFKLHLPSKDLMDHLGLRWSGHKADFVDEAGRRAAFDPSAWNPGAGALLVREDLIRASLGDLGLSLCWTVRGEKMVLSASGARAHNDAFQLSGVYILDEEGVRGYLAGRLETEVGGDSPTPPRIIIRTPENFRGS